MVKRFLITTALEQSWPDHEPVLFLGEWCRLYSRKNRWSKIDAEVMPYHWNDRAKLRADYSYLQEFYERILRDLGDHLNKIHGVAHGVRYWRILVGPWLGYFIQILFDRWSSIQQACKSYEISGTMSLYGRDQLLVPNDMSEFIQFFTGDEWNQFIYDLILRDHTSIPCSYKESLLPKNESKKNSKNPTKPRVKMLLKKGYIWIANNLCRDRDAFFLTTYLPFKDEILINLKFRQMPQLWLPNTTVNIPADYKKRQWALHSNPRNEFESFACTLIAKQIPKTYLEGYPNLLEQIARLKWPKHPRLIWSSGSCFNDDVFKAWAAEKTEQGAPFVTGQHGGHDGTGLWTFVEDHEIAISDNYLSWGWTTPNQPKVIPVGQFKSKKPFGIQHAKKSGILMVTGILPRQSCHMRSMFVAGQWLNYFEDQCAFVRNLPPPLQQALTVRLHTNDYGWDQIARWRDAFPNLCLNGGHSNIDNLIRQSRLYVSTYNATTFLESFTMNVPTVMFWNPKHWELRDSAIPYFNDLKRVGIFHETPESAARHIETIWDDIDSWWNNIEVRKVLECFKKRYCHLSDDLFDNITNSLPRDAIAT
jgi:putative transferase (TIGR04331 family)